jgi:hypothetical protein
MITAGLFLLGVTAFCQAKQENGTIYIKHPYIDVVNNLVKDYTTGDYTAFNSAFADTATVWQSGMEKFVPLGNLIQAWNNDKNYITDISVKAVGYPDFLHYTKGDAQIVQSWWNWSAKVKKTGEVITVPMVLFDEFNADGKIVRQYVYGDFSKARAVEM